MTAPDNPSAQVPPVSRLRQVARGVPLRTRIILLVVGIAGLGLLVNAIAVSSLMREVSYSRVDQELESAVNSWAPTVEIF